MTQPFQLASTAFADGEIMPDRFTCQGANVSPPLDIHGVPDGTVSLALILHDPDAPHGDYTHWTVWGIDPRQDNLDEDDLPDEVLQGVNDFGHSHYDGPCPPSGVHRYMFDLYALDARVTLPEGAPDEDIRMAISDHAIAKTTLMGRFGAKALA